jgi:hypothetical protein
MQGKTPPFSQKKSLAFLARKKKDGAEGLTRLTTKF